MARLRIGGKNTKAGSEERLSADMRRFETRVSEAVSLMLVACGEPTTWKPHGMTMREFLQQAMKKKRVPIDIQTCSGKMTADMWDYGAWPVFSTTSRASRHLGDSHQSAAPGADTIEAIDKAISAGLSLD